MSRRSSSHPPRSSSLPSLSIAIPVAVAHNAPQVATLSHPSTIVCAGAALRRLVRVLHVSFAMAHDHTPYASYGLLTGIFNVSAWALASAIGRRSPNIGDLLVLGMATQQVTRTVARDRVTSTVRRPFVDRTQTGDEKPKPEGPRRALGELLTCPYCLAPWTALALTGIYALAPRATRTFTGVLAVAAVSDFLNRAYTTLKQNDSPARATPALPQSRAHA